MGIKDITDKSILRPFLGLAVAATIAGCGDISGFFVKRRKV